jgi:hypothetical protein
MGPDDSVGRVERFAAWVVTGPVGHLAAAVADLAVFSWRLARGRFGAEP